MSESGRRLGIRDRIYWILDAGYSIRDTRLGLKALSAGSV